MIAESERGPTDDGAAEATTDEGAAETTKSSMDAALEPKGSLPEGDKEREDSQEKLQESPTAKSPSPETPPENGTLTSPEDAHSEIPDDDECPPHVSDGEDDDEDKLVINECTDRKEPPTESGGGEADVKCTTTKRSIASATTKRSIASVEAEDATSPKRRRTDEELPTSEKSDSETLSVLESSISFLKRDLEGLDILLRQKEEEWNSLLRLQKKKEEAYLRLLRKRQTLILKEALEKGEDEAEKDSQMVFLPEGMFSSVGGSQIPAMMLRHFLGGMSIPQIVNYDTKPPYTSNGPTSSHGNVSVIDIHTSNKKSFGARDVPQISISPETHSKLGKQLGHSLSSVKPILPKPLSGIDEAVLNSMGSLHSLSLPTTGFGPHGPTVSIHQLIAAHRKDNPQAPPIRGAKRGSWRHKYDSNSKRSSSREPDRPSSVSSSNSETDVRINAPTSSKGSSSTNSNLLPMNDPSVSYKDVLLQFAQLTQAEKSPGSPQISIIPVGPVGSSETLRKSESTPDSTSVSRELPASSQSGSHGNSLEGSSALAKLLLESGQVGGSKPSSVDLPSCSSPSPQYLTLSALLSGVTTSTVKDKTIPLSQGRPKKSIEEGNSNPKCQGCHKNRAQFVCAGCGNQWYCSRECQVAAWEEHSEHCNN